MKNLYKAYNLTKNDFCRLGLIITVLFLAGCQNGTTTQPTYHTDVENMQQNTMTNLTGTWVLRDISEAYTSGDIDLTSLEQIPTLNIDIKEKHISGNSSCNNYMGVIETIDNKKLSFGTLASTKMACIDINIEVGFLQALSKTQSYNYKNNRLVLLDEMGKHLLKFEKQ